MMAAPDIRNPVAAHLCKIVSSRPGIHFRSLARAANLSSVGQLRHHLDRLQRRRVLIEVSDGQFKRFFTPGQYHASDMPVLARFSRPMTRRIGALLLERPMRRVELRQRLRCADSTLGYHLNRMVAAGDLRRHESDPALFELVDPALVRGLPPLGGPPGPGRPPAPPHHLPEPRPTHAQAWVQWPSLPRDGPASHVAASQTSSAAHA